MYVNIQFHPINACLNFTASIYNIFCVVNVYNLRDLSTE